MSYPSRFYFLSEAVGHEIVVEFATRERYTGLLESVSEHSIELSGVIGNDINDNVILEVENMSIRKNLISCVYFYESFDEKEEGATSRPDETNEQKENEDNRVESNEDKKSTKNEEPSSNVNDVEKTENQVDIARKVHKEPIESGKDAAEPKKEETSANEKTEN